MEFYGLPPIGQKQKRPMDGAQFHPLSVDEAGGGTKKDRPPARLQIIDFIEQVHLRLISHRPYGTGAIVGC
jgi:hypothetical protein